MLSRSGRSIGSAFPKTTAFLLSVGLCVGAWAMPYHRALPSAELDAATTCVFPDGTGPKNKPENHCYNVPDFLRAYGIDQLHALGLTGKGQTIILVDSYGSPTAQADLDHFSETFNLPRTTIQFIYPNGTYVNPVNDEDHQGWAEETTLDLEWAHAIAPDATIVNIVSSSSETTGMTGMQDLFDGIKMAIRQYPSAILSMSFGTGEGTFTTDQVTQDLLGSLHQVFQQATNAGMTLLASAGDSGSAEMNLAQTSLLPYANASYPASDPLVTAVGGTQLQYGWSWTPEGTADDYWACKLQKLSPCPKDFLKSKQTPGSFSEIVWKEDWAIAAGGGGISTVFRSPKYQASLDPELQQMLKGYRSIPDVSLNAAINGGVDVYTSFLPPKDGTPSPQWQSFGGTSCASPETAALVALAGEQASRLVGKPVGIGSLNSIVYSLPSSDFNDIVSDTFGNNSQVRIDNDALYFNPAVLKSLGPTKVPPVAVPGYETMAGYDIATGFGSPKAVSFVVDVARARVAELAR